jgi:hypothetical protein
MRLSTPTVLVGAVVAVLVVIAATVVIALTFIDDDDDPTEAVEPGTDETVATGATVPLDGAAIAALAPYVDAVVAATSPGIAGLGAAAGIDDTPFRCTVQQMLHAVRLDRLDASGVTPEEMGEAPNLVTAGFILDQSEIDQVVAGARGCGVGEYVGRVLISGLTADAGDGSPLASAEGTDCFVTTISSDGTFTPAIVDQLLGTGDPGLAIDSAAVGAYAACPSLLVELYTQVFEGAGVTVTDEGRACIEAATTERAFAVAGAVVGRDSGATRALGTEIFTACEAELTD